ncbi:MAG: sensor domain-containing phosphodiesterase [Angustibacter sp.]
MIHGALRDVEPRLREALAHRRLDVHYQPVVALPSAQRIAVESLARWNDAELGTVPPDVFVPVAERTGLIHELGAQVLGQACRAGARWAAAGQAARVSVNVSPLQLTAGHFEAEVAAALEESGLDPALLVLEITESAAVDDLAATARRLHGLRALGVRVALDDFGIGHSPLSMLRELPLDILKIDRSFVSQVHENARDAVIARLLIDTAHTLGLTVCGEGVETRDQARQLLGLGCDTAQGWYFGRPAPDPNDVADRTGAVGTVLGPPAVPPGTSLDVAVAAPIQIGSDELTTILRPDGHVLYASPGALAVLGYTPSQLMGRSVTDFLHPDERQGILRAPKPDWGRAPWSLQHRVHHQDGSWRWMRTRAQLVYDGDDHPAQVVATSRDVTRHVQTRRQLESTEATLRWAFDQSPVGMALSDLDGRIVRTNGAFAEMLGRGPDDLAGHSVSEITHPDDDPADAVNLDRLREPGASTQRVTKRYLHRDGSPVPAHVWASTLDDERGRPTYVVAHIIPAEGES